MPSNVAPGDDRGQGLVAPRAAAEDVSDPVDGHGAAGGPQPGADEVPPLPIEVRESQAAHSTSRGGYDLGQFHEQGPEALGVDADPVEVRYRA